MFKLLELDWQLVGFVVDKARGDGTLFEKSLAKTFKRGAALFVGCSSHGTAFVMHLGERSLIRRNSGASSWGPPPHSPQVVSNSIALVWFQCAVVL